MSSATIGLLGDVMLGRAVGEALDRVSPDELWSDGVRDVAARCDAVVCNLECCVSERGTPTERIPRKPFFFRGPPQAIGSLRAIGVKVASLANNHALDYGTEALLDTLDLVREGGIVPAGAGTGAPEARRGVAVEAGGVRLGVVAVSDHPAEFAAGDGVPGIALAELYRGVPQWTVEEIQRLRAECDAVIAFPHWGPNMTSAPAGWQREAAKRMHEAGADAVAGHSAHTFHGVGWSKRGPTLFDVGDAIDDYAVDPALRNDLGVMALWRPADRDAELEIVGLELEFCHTRLARGAEAEWIAARLERACGDLGTEVERLDEQRFAVRPR